MQKRPSIARKALFVICGGVLAVLIVAVAVAWYFAGEVKRQALTVRHDTVDADRNVYHGDPWEAHRIPFREVNATSDLGDFPAWLTDGDAVVWAVLIHGKGEDRTELLRVLPLFVKRGIPTLTITYRNDPGVPASPSGLYGFGADEWEDAQAAAAYALRNGAQRLILVGYSMGGAIALSFIYRSTLAERVVGLVLDSPVLDFAALLDARAAEMGVPRMITEAAKVVASLRFGLDYRALDYIEPAGALRMPVLLIHGTADIKVPLATSDRLAAAQPRLVTYEVFEGAGHTSSWNDDRRRYERAVGALLDRALQPVSD